MKARIFTVVANFQLMKMHCVTDAFLGTWLKLSERFFKDTAVFAGNDTFLTENITQDKKRFITQSKHMIF